MRTTSTRCDVSTVLSVLAALICIAAAMHAQDDQADWVDPNDMLNFDLTTGEMRKHTADEVENEPAGHAPAKNKMKSGNQPINKPDTVETPVIKSCDCSSHTTQLLVCRKRVKELESAQKHVSPPCDNQEKGSEIQFFRQYVVSLLKQFDQDIGLPTLTYADSYEADIEISPSDVETLRKYGEAGHISIQDAHAILVTMVTRIRHQDGTQFKKSVFWSLYSLVMDNVTHIIQVCGLVVMVQVMMLLQKRLCLSWRMLLFQLLLIFFVLSVVWTWWHMYKVALADRHAVLAKDKPAECMEGSSVSFWQTFVSVFQITTDPCSAYYEKLLVDPMWEVSPMQAIAKTITKFFVEPLEHIGVALSKFVKAVLVGLPITISPLVLGFIMVVSLLLLMMCCGYRIRIWPFIYFEPTPRLPVSASSEDYQQRIDDITTQVQRLTFQKLDSGTKPVAVSHESLGQATTEPIRPVQGPPVNITNLTKREPCSSQSRSRRRTVQSRKIDNTEETSLNVIPKEKCKDILAGGDAGSSLAITEEHKLVDNDSDFEVIEEENSKESEAIEMLSALHSQED